MTDGLAQILARQPRNSLRIVRVTVSVVAPLTVKLPDGTPVTAVGLRGTTWTVGDAGAAFLAEGSIPLVIPIT